LTKAAISRQIIVCQLIVIYFCSMKNKTHYQKIVDRLVAEPDFAKDFFKKFLTEKYKQQLDLDRIHWKGDTFMCEKLRPYYLNAVFEIGYKEKEVPEALIVALLIEFETRDRRIITLDLMEYLQESEEFKFDFKHNADGVVAVLMGSAVPMVFYRSDNEFKGGSLRNQMNPGYGEFLSFVPEVPFIVYPASFGRHHSAHSIPA
jgi:hypothetical protein